MEREHSCDVLIAGGGIAALCAAWKAGEAGCSVTLIPAGGLFSGSSFYPGTWGLGLIGPEDASDRDDLVDAVCRVGCGMASRAMAESFVSGISPAIAELRGLGVKLRRARQREQREFIPCFDHKTRDWNGIEFESVRQVLGKRLEELGVTVLDRGQVLRLVTEGGRVRGAAALFRGRLRFLGCRAFVLATGGYGGIFQRRLCTGDVAGMGQALALEAGCSLIHMEFMQIMPGFLSPAAGTVFNEKAFRFSDLTLPGGAPLLPPGEESRRLLELRSTHGPFTSRLESRAVDLALARAEEGAEVTYSPELRENPPEFVAAYFDWLAREKGLTAADPVRIGLFAHAANGGVAIGPDASAGVPGLFACGEVTGGMHGADRIGGLSTANGLVFGGRAGQAAAAAAAGAPEPPGRCEFQSWSCPETGEMTRTLRQTMTRYAMVPREGAGLSRALETVEALDRRLRETRAPTDAAEEAARTRRLECRLVTARCVLQAASLRRESRGSHFRADFPRQDPALARPILVDRGGAAFLERI